MGRPSCMDCESAYKYTIDDTPCYKCFPGVHYRNKTIFKIHSHVQGQYIMSMSGAVALDLLAIHKTLDCYGVPYNEDRAELIDMVQKLSGISISIQQADAKLKQKK